MNTYAQFCGCGAAMRPIHHIGNQSLFLCRDGHSTKVIDCKVNEDFTRDLYFSDLPSFKVDLDISIEDNVLTFGLYRQIGENLWATADCSMPVLPHTMTQMRSSNGDMRYAESVDIDSWLVVKDTPVTLLDVWNFEAEEGQTFTLTDEQIKELQRLVNEYAEQLFEEVV
ncbi:MULTISPECIES: hypothetical protein [unclassified Acinetobacter]|uniref:hypothetical protein n=1 Tax=unclassified Acinetobacter TaxID=196816 RepID=UPI0015D316B7|nr:MULTISPECIES: hypothetical protein [unclassified Acinetobacter]